MTNCKKLCKIKNLTFNNLCVILILETIHLAYVMVGDDIKDRGDLQLFKIGDKVVYPMHGAGIIESIEEKEILGETRRYYIMRIPVGNMKVMIPMDNVDSIGLREVASMDVIRTVEQVLQTEETPMSSNWNQRYRANMDKIRSGDIVEVADVVRNLVQRERQKGLSTGERKMLDNARQILVSEIVLAKEMVAEEAYDWLEDRLSNKNASL